MSPRRSLVLALAFAAPLLAGCGRARWEESIEHSYAARDAPAREVQPDPNMLGNPNAAIAAEAQLERDGYERVGTATYTCEDCHKLRRRAARRAAKAGADVFVVAAIASAGERHIRQRGYVIWGSGTQANPQYSNVTPARTVSRTSYTIHYWRARGE